MRGLRRQVMGECVMKKMDKRLLVGVVPTRREAFENETTTRQKGEVMKRFRQLSKELETLPLEAQNRIIQMVELMIEQEKNNRK